MGLTQINGSSQIQTGTITNTQINGSAGIDYSKLTLTDDIVNADINSAAAITYAKLNLSVSILNSDIAPSAGIVYGKLSLANGIVNADINSAAAIAYSKLHLTGDIVNADISSSAGIVYSKLTLTGGIVDADINAAAAIQTSKLADGANFVNQTMNATISDGVRWSYSTLQTFDPILDVDALVTKSYVDAVAVGLDIHPAVVALAFSNVSSLSGSQIVDGVSLATSNRVLLVGQTNEVENGIWVVQTGAWTRPTDFSTGGHAAGTFVFVEDGTLYASTGWVNTNPSSADIIDTDHLTFTQFSSAGLILAGAGLTKTGNTLAVGQGNGITVNSTNVAFNASGAADPLGGLTAGSQTWYLAILQDSVTGGNVANAISLTSNGTGIKIDNVTIGANGSNQLHVTAGTVNAGELNSLASTDFLRTSASSSLATTNTLTVASGAFINFTVTGGLQIGGTSLTTSIANLNLLGTIVTRETPTGSVDGVNSTFSLANTPVLNANGGGSEEVYVNGVQQDSGVGNDYTISTNVITFNAGAIPQTGSKVRVNYRY